MEMAISLGALKAMELQWLVRLQKAPWFQDVVWMVRFGRRQGMEDPTHRTRRDVVWVVRIDPQQSLAAPTHRTRRNVVQLEWGCRRAARLRQLRWVMVLRWRRIPMSLSRPVGALDGTPAADDRATQDVVAELWTTIQAMRQQLAGGTEPSTGSAAGSAFLTAGSRPPSPTDGNAGVASGDSLLDPVVANRLLQMPQEAPLLYGAMSEGAHLSHSASSDSTTEVIQAEVRRQMQLLQHEHNAQLNALAEENLALRRELMGERAQNQDTGPGQGWGWVKGVEGLGSQASSSSFVPTMPRPRPSIPIPNPQNLISYFKAPSKPVSPQVPGAGAQVPGAEAQVQGVSGQVTQRAAAQVTGQVTGAAAQVTGAFPQVPGAAAQVAGQVTGASAQVTGQVTGASAQVTGASAQVTGAAAQVTGALTGALSPGVAAQVAGALPQVPGAAAQVTGVAAQVTGALPQVPGAAAVAAQVTGALPQVPGAAAQVTGAFPQVAGAAAQVPGAHQASAPSHIPPTQCSLGPSSGHQGCNWHQPPTQQSPANTTPANSSGTPLPTGADGLSLDVLQQLVAALTSQGRTASGPETVKPGISALPKMPTPSGTSALTFADWLHAIGPAMADLSDSSEELWSCLKQETEAWYALYLATDPLSRLSLRTDPSPALMSSKWNRTRTRMESMILEASPSEVKEEISAARIAGIFPVMCRLYVIFGPGSLQEREEGLRRLTNPQAAKSPKEAVAELRSWRRWCSRFVSLGGTLPDPSILLKALNTITAKPLQDFPEIQFRISLTRASLQVDVLPTSAKVDQLHQHLLSELEVVSRLKSGDACKAQAIDTPGTSAPQKPPKLDPSKDKPKPEPKAVAVPKGGAGDEVPASSEDCRAFLRGGQGCRYGGKCRRPHNWASIPKDRRANLCINCGGEGHRADGCARPKRDKPGDSSSAPSPSKKPPNPPKPKGNLPDAQQVQGLVTGAAKLLEALGSTPKAPPPARDTTLPTQAAAAQAQAVPIAGTPVLSLDALQEQLASLQNQLAQGSQAQAKVVAEVASLDHQTAEVSDRALLDSGATHAVSATCNGPTFPCEVALAGDQVQVWRKNACGTLNPPSTEGSRPQTLLPLGQLVGRLGCKVSWCRRKGLRLNHPKRGPLQTFLSAKGCPELPETMAQELIRELEDQQTSEFQSTVARTIGAIQANAGGSSSQALVEYVREGSISRATAALLVCPALRGFEQAQVLELAQAVSSGDADGWRLLKDLPYTRRLRKRLFKNQWWVNFGPKVSRSLSDAIAQRGYCVLEASELVGKAELIPVLLWACATGRFAGSMCWGGASPVPLSESQELWSRWFWAVASVFQGVCLPFLVEGVAHQDQRTREFARWGQAWTVQFSETRVAATNLDLRHVDSRVLHDLQGTACLETEIQRALCGKGPSLPYLAAASALPDASTPGPVPDVEAIGIEEAGSGAQPGDLDSFGEEFLRDLEALIDKDVGQDVPGEPPEDPKNLSLPTSMQDLRAAEPDPNDLSEKDKSKVAMSPKERASWRRHITAGHLPYRRDCLACTMGAGLGIQHRRVRFKDSFSMSWDISGPFREVGKTGKHSGFRYLFVAGVRVPTCLFRDAATSAPGPSANKPDPGSPTLQSSTPGQVAAPAQSPQQGELDWNSDYSPTEGGEIDPDILFSELEPPAVEEEESLPEHLPPIEAPAPKVESVLDEGPSMSDDEIDKMVASLRHPVDQVLLRFAVPLRNRQSKSLLSAIQYVVTETNRLGIPIKICHSDKEGQSEEIQSWLRQNCIVPSNTQGADAKSNGLAERLVSWFKARMRLHLTAGKVPVQFWPYAAQFASQDHLDGLLDRRPPQLTFGRKVLFRAKAMTNEAKKVFSTWEWGRYLGRSMISAEGHHILKDSTGAVITSRSVRAGLVDVDDELLEPLVAEDPKPVVMPVPPHRLREKTYVAKVAEQELMAEEQASKLLRSGNITPQAVSRMLQHLVQEPAADMKRRGHSSGHWYLGGFRRGPFSGITKATNGLPQVLQVLNQFLLGKARAKGVPDLRWVSVGLFANPEVPVHRDFHNEGSNFGLVIPGITNLWTEEALNSSSVPAGQLAPRQATAPGYP